MINSQPLSQSLSLAPDEAVEQARACLDQVVARETQQAATVIAVRPRPVVSLIGERQILLCQAAGRTRGLVVVVVVL